jgi:hypothetical protein
LAGLVFLSYVGILFIELFKWGFTKKIDAAIFGLDYVFVLLNVYFEVQFDSFRVF